MLTPFPSPEKENGRTSQNEIRNLMIGLMAMMEENANTEKSKYECGIMMRAAKIEQFTPYLLKFAHPASSATIDQRREAFECLDGVLTTLEAFKETHEEPEEPDSLADL